MGRVKQAVIFSLSLALALTAPVAAKPTPAQAAGVTKERSYQIAANYEARTARLTAVGGNEANCVPGSPSAAAIKDILDTTNDLRELAGMRPISNLTSANANAQAAALAMAANNSLTHDIPSDWKCHSAAAVAGASTSNLSLGWGTFPAKMVASGQWRDDRVPSLGHRRWLMKPDMSAVGIGGFAGASSASGVIGTFGSSATSNSNPKPDGFSWPSAGYIPFDFVPNGTNNWWHVSLKCSLTNLGVTITGPGGQNTTGTLTQLDDGYGGWEYKAYSIAAPTVPEPATNTEASYTLTLTSPCNSFTGFTTKILGDAAQPVTVTAPIVTKVVGPNNDNINTTAATGLTWLDTGWGNGQRTLTAKAADGYYLVGQSVWTFADVTTKVTVPKPTVLTHLGGHNDIITPVITTGVVYQTTDWVAGVKKVTATAKNADYELIGTTEWIFLDPLISLAPLPPTVTKVDGDENDMIDIPVIAGVRYADTGWVNGQRTVTATAEPGYTLTGTSSWTFSDGSKEQPISDIPRPRFIPYPGDNNDVVIPVPTDGISYEVGNWENGTLKVVPKIKPGYKWVGEGNPNAPFLFEDGAQLVEIPDFIQTMVPGPANDKIELPTIPHVKFIDSGWAAENPEPGSSKPRTIRRIYFEFDPGYFPASESTGTSLRLYHQFFHDYNDNVPFIVPAEPKQIPVPGLDNDKVITVNDPRYIYDNDLAWRNGMRLVYSWSSNNNVARLTGKTEWYFYDTSPSDTSNLLPQPWPWPAWRPFVDRWSGTSAIDTAIAVAKNSRPHSDNVFIANNVGFQDSLAAVPVAHYAYGAPLLLTDPNIASPQLIAELQRLSPTKVFIQGGRFAISDVVIKQLKDALPNLTFKDGVQRVSGASDIDTAVAAARAGKVSRFRNPYKVFIANNQTASDALAAGAIAARLEAPILLVDPDKPLPDVVAKYLKDENVVDVTMVGGRFAIPERFGAEIKAVTGYLPKRVSGASDIDTALAVSKLISSHRQIFLTTNQSFQDALGAGPAAARASGTVFLTNGQCISKELQQQLAQLQPQVVHVIGGKVAMNPAIEKLSVCPA